MGEAFITRRGGGGIDFSNCPFDTGSLGSKSTKGIHWLKTSSGTYYDPMDYSYVILSTSENTTGSTKDMIILKCNKADSTFTKIYVMKASGTIGSSNALDKTYVYRKTATNQPYINVTEYGALAVNGILVP